MYRIDNATAAKALAAATEPGPNPDHYFTGGDPATGIPATIVEAEWLNMIQEEIVNLILGAGLTPDKASRTQMRDAVNTLIRRGSHIGKHTYTIPAEAWSPTITGGCSWFTRVQVAANRPEIAYVAFDDGVEQSAEARIAMPKSWDGGAVQAQALWSHGTAEVYGVAFAFRCAVVGNDDAHDTAFGAEVVVSDTGGTANDLYVTDISADITPGGTATDDAMLVIRCSRKVTDVYDTLDTDARLEHVRLIYTTDTGTDD